jgi:hypothetical protein
VTGKWVKLKCEVDTTNHVLVADVQHLTIFTVLAPTSTGKVSVSWSLITGIIGGMVVLAILAQQFMRRRGKWHWDGTKWVER